MICSLIITTDKPSTQNQHVNKNFIIIIIIHTLNTIRKTSIGEIMHALLLLLTQSMTESLS